MKPAKAARAGDVLLPIKLGQILKIAVPHVLLRCNIIDEEQENCWKGECFIHARNRHNVVGGFVEGNRPERSHRKPDGCDSDTNDLTLLVRVSAGSISVMSNAKKRRLLTCSELDGGPRATAK
jgi:hypothetical protein